MIEHLAGMFRYTFACSHTELVSFADELALVDNYLRLEKARLRGRLRVEIVNDGNLTGVFVPGLIIQPLVENAIKHGVAKMLGGGALKLEIKLEGNLCRVSVRNQYEPGEGLPDISQHKLFREGHALANVRERLSPPSERAGETLKGNGSVSNLIHRRDAESAEGAQRRTQISLSAHPPRSLRLCGELLNRKLQTNPLLSKACSFMLPHDMLYCKVGRLYNPAL